MAAFIIGSIICLLIPSFYSEESLLIELVGKYLEYEPIVAVGLFIFLCSALFSVKNKDRHIEAANRVLQLVLPISVGAGLIEGRIDLSFWLNWIVLGFAYIFYFLLLVVDGEVVGNKNIAEGQEVGISYNPVEELEQLFPQHKAQAKRLAKIISDSSAEPFSICLSGKWGTGKTSVINVVEELLREKDNYAFIRINAIELDDKKALINYFMSEIKACLKEKGVYVGVASEYKEFLVSTVGTVTTDSFGTFFEKRIFGGEKDYREQKEKLENLLTVTFENGKLVLIVDDIERCQPDVAREYLFLIKEVATMRNCVSIFVTDYNVLKDLLGNNTNAQTSGLHSEYNEFLDKFFNYRINLYDETLEDIFAFYDKSYDEGTSIFTSIYYLIGVSPGTWYKDALKGIDLHIEKQKETNSCYRLSEENARQQEDKVRRVKENREAFVQCMQNTRNVVKFYNTFNRNVQRCYKQLFRTGVEEEKKELVCKFIRERNVGQIILFLSFVEACFPDELQQIIKKGAEYIEQPLYGENILLSEERQFLIEMRV